MIDFWTFQIAVAIIQIQKQRRTLKCVSTIRYPVLSYFQYESECQILVIQLQNVGARQKFSLWTFKWACHSTETNVGFKALYMSISNTRFKLTVSD